jgi:hypothetical protein
VDARVQAGDTARRVVVCFATFVMDEPVPMPEPPMSEWTAAGSSRLVLAQSAAERDLAAQGEAAYRAKVAACSLPGPGPGR